ncbi:MAG TPA: TIGR01440 family protein [Bacilli bacterium]|nr:TIGR01440 family protein [Bacilli bacterium]
MLEEAFQAIRDQTRQVVDELQQVAALDADKLLVIGCSSSEVVGLKIGTGGSLQAAAHIVDAILEARDEFGFHVAFQCCEHLNRALVVEQATVRRFGLEEVTVVPVPQAGGAVASTAYKRLTSPVMVEKIQAHAGIDIGDTLIGMHLRPVAVPVRPTVKEVGEAHVTMATTRPKLIGGARALYVLE